MNIAEKAHQKQLFSPGDATVSALEPTVEQLLDARAPKNKGEKFAEDLVYTVNHAIVCALSDVLDPAIGSYTQKLLGARLVMNPLHDWAHNKFEHHDHDHAHGHDHHGHHHHDHAHGHEHGHSHGHHDHHGCGHTHPTGGTFTGNLKHWIIGEAVGDLGAIPFTLGMQYAAPGVMRGIQNAAEPLLGRSFRWSANRYAKKWAYDNGYDAHSPEARARAKELYQHEISHTPHAFMWTASAAGLNILTQKFITKNPGKTSHLILGKGAGSVGTLGLVLAFRTLLPGKVEQLDAWNTKNIAEPLTRRVGGWFGIDSETIDRVLEYEQEFKDGHNILHRSSAERGEENVPQKRIIGQEAHLQAPLSLNRLIG